MQELAVTAIGADRPGIVAAVTRVLQDRGGNLEDSAMTILGGHFAIVLLVTTDENADTLHSALSQATGELGLTVSVGRAAGRRKPVDATHLLSVYGTDRPGIVAGVTETLADLGANITDLETQVIGSGDDAVYAMAIELVAPDDEGLTERLDAVCARLGVDHTLRTIEAETFP